MGVMETAASTKNSHAERIVMESSKEQAGRNGSAGRKIRRNAGNMLVDVDGSWMWGQKSEHNDEVILVRPAAALEEPCHSPNVLLITD
jgi:hypothetical protein